MILAIDIDGVLCTEERQFSRPLAKPIEGAAQAIASLRAAGHKIILYSARTWAEIEVTKHWLETNGIQYDGIQLGKMVVDRFVDDRAIHFSSWDEVLTQLRLTGDYPGDWRAEHHLKILRRETKRILEEIAACADVINPVLEVGPMWSGSSVFKRMPETFVDAKQLFTGKGHDYRSLDIDPITGADYIGDFLNIERVIGRDRFGCLILMSAIEHIPEIWKVPDAVYAALKPDGVAHIMTPWSVRLHGPHPDSWRLSDEAYKALFADRKRFEILSISKIGAPADSLDPIGFYCKVRALK